MVDVDELEIVEALQHEVRRVVVDAAARVVADPLEQHLEGHAVEQVLARMQLEADVDALLVAGVENRPPALGQLNVKTGEVIAMASLPDYDPNDPADALKPDRLNRVSAGVFEVGSIFKSFTFAMALDTHTLTLNDSVDASRPIRVGGFTIDDYRGGKKRVLSVPEVFYFSSNIGTAKMALQVGSTQQQAYLKRFGFFDRPVTELPEVAAPMVPKKWPDVTAMTVAFGHGIAVSPLQVAIADASVVNGGKLIPATFFPRTEEEAQKLAVQVISPETSASMRYLLQTNV